MWFTKKKEVCLFNIIGPILSHKEKSWIYGWGAFKTEIVDDCLVYTMFVNNEKPLFFSYYYFFAFNKQNEVLLKYLNKN